MARGCQLLILTLCLTTVAPQVVSAQVYIGGGFPKGGSVELGGGGAWVQGFEIESPTAQLSRATGAQRFDLFSTDADVQRFTGAHLRAGVYLTSSISVEGGVRYATPVMSIRLSGDVESAEETVATQTLSHYVFDGSVLLHFNGAAFAGGRGVPFVSVGGGQVRELHEGRELVETGRAVHGTAGLKYWLGTGRRRVGLRAEIGVVSRAGAADSDDSGRVLPMALGGLTFLF
ncbi:hypothetical protein BH24ACI4_BH24ACI4_20330 [soil metagenome]